MLHTLELMKMREVQENHMKEWAMWRTRVPHYRRYCRIIRPLIEEHTHRHGGWLNVANSNMMPVLYKQMPLQVRALRLLHTTPCRECTIPHRMCCWMEGFW